MPQAFAGSADGELRAFTGVNGLRGQVMRRPYSSTLFIFLVSVWAVPARAEITIIRAEYAAGVLVVEGETSRSNQLVTLDGKYRTRTDRYNEFQFRIRYRPPACGVTIRAGQEVRPARIVNCDDTWRPAPWRKKARPSQ